MDGFVVQCLALRDQFIDCRGFYSFSQADAPSNKSSDVASAGDSSVVPGPTALPYISVGKKTGSVKCSSCCSCCFY